VELGVLAQIITKVVYIEKGDVSQILTLDYTVKVPTGMMEDDLARPVVTVKEGGTIRYEIYSFGEQVVVMPTDKVEKSVAANSAVFQAASKEIDKKLSKFLQGIPYELQVTGANKIKILVADQDKGRIIGKKGSNIMKLEEKMGLSIDVETR
jgi:ATPase